MLCDVCNKKSEVKRYNLTTGQVVISPGYWERLYQLVESGTTGISREHVDIMRGLSADLGVALRDLHKALLIYDR